MRRLKTETIVLSILWINTIISLCISIQYISTQFKLGIAVLLISTLLVYRFPKIVFYILIITLPFSIVDLIVFGHFAFHFSLNSLRISLPPTMLFLCLGFKRRNIIRQWFAEDEESRKEKEASQKRKFHMFKREFQHYSLTEIEKKLENDNLVSEARDALTALMNEKRNS